MQRVAGELADERCHGGTIERLCERGTTSKDVWKTSKLAMLAPTSRIAPR